VTPGRIQSVVNARSTSVRLDDGFALARGQVDFSLMTFLDSGGLLMTDASGIRGISTRSAASASGSPTI
jgi:hypothetical protein